MNVRLEAFCVVPEFSTSRKLINSMFGMSSHAQRMLLSAIVSTASSKFLEIVS